jgi:hypothetical protein
MTLAVTDFLQLMPTFVQGSHTLHNLLVSVTEVLAFSGILLLCAQAAREHSVGVIWPMLVRLIVVVILVGNLGSWGDLLNDAVNDVDSLMGLNGVSGGVFAAYRQAVAQKFGSNSQASSQSSSSLTQSANPSFPASEGDASGGFTVQQPTGVTLNHYGYEPVGSKDYDPQSAQGSGAFPFDSAPQSLVPLQSAALSADVAQKYNLQPGQSFTAVVGGQTYNLVYADKTADYVTGSIDVYDPDSVLGSNQLTAVTSVNGGAVPSNTGGGPLGGWISKISDSLIVGILWPLVHLLSLIAMSIMWLMTGIQQILYTIEIAVSPLFIGMLMIPRLVGTATRFFTSLVAICVWPMGWTVTDLLTRALIDIAVNPTNSIAQSVFANGTMMLGYWVLLAVWVILSSFAAPIVIGIAFMAGSSGLAAVFGGTVGATAMRASGGGVQAATIAAGAAATPISIASSSRMTAYQNFAKRPMSNGNSAQTTTPTEGKDRTNV